LKNIKKKIIEESKMDYIITIGVASLAQGVIKKTTKKYKESTPSTIIKV